MTATEFIKLLTPPLFVNLVRRTLTVQRHPIVQGSAQTRVVEWEYIPEGWLYVRTHPEVKGWNVQDVLETYKRKWDKFVAMAQGTGPLGVAHESELVSNEDIFSHNTMMAFGYAIALAARHADALSVLDWGGGIGHYYVLAKSLLPKVTIDYHCKDMPLLAEYGAQLFPQAHFYDDESCLDRTYDFVMASSSLQFAEEWQRVLARLAEATKQFLYIANLPIVRQSPSFVIVQRPYNYGYNTEYLGWCLNQNELLTQAKSDGLELVREFIYGHKPIVKNAPAQNEYRGFLFRRQSPVAGAQ